MPNSALLAALLIASAQAQSPSPSPRPTVGVEPSAGAVCEHVVDSAGKSLYMFDKDSSSESRCKDACAIDWPPFLSPDFTPPTVSVPGKQELAGTPIARGDGTQQNTYGGHPLYTYKGDKDPKDTKGHCLSAFDGKFYLVKPDGTACSCESQAPIPAPAPPSGGFSCSGCFFEFDPSAGKNRCRDSCFNWYNCSGCGNNGCGTNDVCGWTPGWRCFDPNPFLSQCRPECCEFKNDFTCTGSNFCGGGGGDSCTTESDCGWTPGWRCYVPFSGCDPFDRNCLSRCGCFDAQDPSCPGFG